MTNCTAQMLYLCRQDLELIFEAETSKSLFQTNIYLPVAKVNFFCDEGELPAGDSFRKEE